MRDTRGFWLDQYAQANNFSLKGHSDSGWKWMLKLSKIMLNKSAQKNPAAATTGRKNFNKLIYSSSVSRKAE
ncbi:hypothetical protein [Lacticaseibacillus paracasei]|uniref:hypothetical protein n=1 Tax=Lacticaseibacillus paracasei TaxID=1597 RepID=UPI001E58CD8D|nr:hypothetical protein [Lacticaseibacillus paracasei]